MSEQRKSASITRSVNVHYIIGAEARWGLDVARIHFGAYNLGRISMYFLLVQAMNAIRNSDFQLWRTSPTSLVNVHWNDA